MTDNEIKALAESILPFEYYAQRACNYRHIISKMCEMYKAALSGTERVECYLPTPIEEYPEYDGWYTVVAYKALDFRYWYDSLNGWNIPPKASGYTHWLKKTVLTVVKESEQ